jgi:cytochrome c-type biogenesis protein CcmH/NrfG
VGLTLSTNSIPAKGISFYALILLLLSCSASFGAESRTTVLAYEGKAQSAKPPAFDWTAALTNQALNVGDRFRTMFRSRATLRLTDLSILRVNELTLLEIRDPQSADKESLLDLQEGEIFFFNREKPARMDFRTPVASGAIRGTEFRVQVAQNGRTIVTLLEGEVYLSNAQGDLAIRSGEQALIEPGQPPVKTPMIDAVAPIQWCLYYPAVLDVGDAGFNAADQQVLADSIAAYRDGDLLRALELYPTNRQPASDQIYQAALVLAVGQVEQAKKMLPAVPTARALETLINTVQGKPVSESQPATASEWLAESYYRQSKFQLDEALKAAREATRVAPGFGYAWARVAELEFSFGHTGKARAALAEALKLSPRNAQAWALQGFLLNAQNHPKAALEAFNRAIELDSNLGNAWLGRGLTKIRQGHDRDGREDLQVAATMEPNRALLRSYLGKAFAADYDDKRAETELRRAKELDRNDPTAPLYTALLYLQENRPNEAVEELELSQDLNDNRQLYRSKFLLDEDRAVRSANLAAIYRDVGMSEVSVQEASRAVNTDYGNFSAHLFLADSFNALNDPRRVNLRFETAAFSELLIANLLAPADMGTFSQHISQQEYSRFFAGNRFGAIGGGEYWSRGDWTGYLSHYGVVDNSSYALDAWYHSENGERRNNDLEQLTYSVKFKQQLTPRDGVYLQAIYYSAESGDVAQYWDWDRSLPAVGNNVPHPDFNLRIKEKQEPNLYAGYHHEWQPGNHTLLLVGRLMDNFDLRGEGDFATLLTSNGVPLGELHSGPAAPKEIHTDFTGYSAEVQQILQVREHQFIVGTRYQTGESETESVALNTRQAVTVDLRRFSAYAYSFWQVADPLRLVAGVTYDKLDYPENISAPPVSERELSKDQVSPKAGFYWTPTKDTTVHGLYARSLGGVYFDTSIRIEPTQLAGFNQAFRSVTPESFEGLIPGSEFQTFGLGVEQKLPTRTYVTLVGQVLTSETERSIGILETPIFPPPNPPRPASPAQLPAEVEFEESSLTVVLNQLIGKLWSVGAAYRLTEAELEEDFISLPERFREVHDRDVRATLHQVNLFAHFNHPSGFFAQANSIWSQQDNRGYSPKIPGDDFWQHNAFVGYRFFHRRAEARIGVLNITDQNYRLNPLTLYAELPRGRTLSVSLRFNF